jgi:hypothetical protein
MRLLEVYSLERDQSLINAMQEASRDRPDLGLSPQPALVGTPAWWRAIEDGTLRRVVVSGSISSVYWSGMGDMPEFEVIASDGSKSDWIRKGDATRYVEGLIVCITYVLHPWKTPNQWGLGEKAKIVLTVEVEDSPRRSSSEAPGPGRLGVRAK